MNKQSIVDIINLVDDAINYPSILTDLSPKHKYAAMHISEKLLLVLLCKNLEKNSTIVEVGTYLGGSASIMAHANPSCSVISFDDFNPFLKASDFHDNLIKELLGENIHRSKENIENSHKEYPNITFVQVTGRNSVGTDLDISVDLYFEDANHSDPILTQNLNFWSQKIKKNGIMILHDHRPWIPKNFPKRFPDVDSAVVRLKQDSNFEFIGTVHSSVIFQKNI